MRKVLIFEKDGLEVIMEINPEEVDGLLSLNAKIIIRKDWLSKEFTLENFVFDVLPMISDKKLFLFNNGLTLTEDDLLNIQVMSIGMNLFQYALTLSK